MLNIQEVGELKLDGKSFNLSLIIWHNQISGTYQSQQVGSQFFAKRPTDNTYVNVNEVSYEPQTALAGARRKYFTLHIVRMNIYESKWLGHATRLTIYK